MTLRRTLIPSVAIGVGLAACVAPGDVEEIKKTQKKILSKLEDIEKKQGAAPAAKPQQPRPGRPDPNQVYAFDVGESAQKGPKDAWVTIIEVSDFQ
jgi:protein-disulfide isomerase